MRPRTSKSARRPAAEVEGVRRPGRPPTWLPALVYPALVYPALVYPARSSLAHPPPGLPPCPARGEPLRSTAAQLINCSAAHQVQRSSALISTAAALMSATALSPTDRARRGHSVVMARSTSIRAARRAGNTAASTPTSAGEHDEDHQLHARDVQHRDALVRTAPAAG